VRTQRALLLLALLVFVGLSAWFSERLGTWHEEVSVYPSTGYRIVEASDTRSHGMRHTGCRNAPSGAAITSSARPVLTLCSDGRSFPIMVSSYIAGWPYWPSRALQALHGGEVFKLRKLGVALGVVTLLVSFWIVRAVSGAAAALAGLSTCAVASCFVLPHALLVHYELAPLPLVLLAGVALRHAARDRRRWLTAALGWLLVGVSLAVNVKAIFLLAPLGAYAFSQASRDTRAGLVRLLWTAPAMLPPLVPVVAFALTDPDRGFAAQVTHRGAGALARLASVHALVEPLNLLVYATDVQAYGDQVAHGRFDLQRWTQVLPGLALVYAGWQLARALGRKAHDRIAAACAAVIAPYVLVVITLYQQQPEANYAPLHAVLGFLPGVAAAAALRPRRRPWFGAALGILCGGLLFNVVKRGDPARVPLSINAVAQRAATEHLSWTPGRTVVTTTYNLAGIFDSLSEGRIVPVQADQYLMRCPRGGERPACMAERWRALAAELGPFTAIVPAKRSLVDEEPARDLASSLALAAQSGLHVEEEARFQTAAGEPVLLAFAVGR
jgi:hypothetical protein